MPSQVYCIVGYNVPHSMLWSYTTHFRKRKKVCIQKMCIMCKVYKVLR